MRPQRGARSRCTVQDIAVLKGVCLAADQPCGNSLAEEWLGLWEKHHGTLPGVQHRRLENISTAQIDREMAPYRSSGRKRHPASSALAAMQCEVAVCCEPWAETAPGALEATDIHSGWTEGDRRQNQRIKQGGCPEEFDTNPAVGRQRDSDARWTKKNEQSHYGWKNQVKADLKTKLILKSKTTPASVHDSQVFEELLDDSAHHSTEHEAHLIKLNAQGVLMRKATRGHPLSEAGQQTNHTISRMRVRMEHIFARMAQMGADWFGSLGLRRATQHHHLSNLVHNMDRYA